jgi:hypothetical protein
MNRNEAMPVVALSFYDVHDVARLKAARKGK